MLLLLCCVLYTYYTFFDNVNTCKGVQGIKKKIFYTFTSYENKELKVFHYSDKPLNKYDKVYFKEKNYVTFY